MDVNGNDSSLAVELSPERGVLVVQGGDDGCGGFELSTKLAALLGLCRQAGTQVGDLVIATQLLGGGSAACGDSVVPFGEDGLGSVDRRVAVPGAALSFVQGVGLYFAGASSLVLSNRM